MMCPKIAGCMANIVDPDQMPHSVASDQGLHCLLWPVCLSVLILRINMVDKHIIFTLTCSAKLKYYQTTVFFYFFFLFLGENGN